MADPVSFSCSCGAFHGHVAAGSGTHLVCHCDACARAQRHFGVPATTADGVGIYQTTPDAFTIDAGAEHLALARLSPKGSYRWYVLCCNRQIGVTGTTAKFPFVGVVTSLLNDMSAIGPVRAHANIPKPDGGVRHKGMGRIVRGLAARSIGALASGRWRDTPFFDLGTGAPVAEPSVLPKDAGRS